MRKIFLIPLAIIILISFTSAYSEEDIISQQELDAINTDNLNAQNLQCRLEKVTVSLKTIHVGYSCLDITRYDETQYLVLRKQLTADISLKLWKVCRQNYTLNQCLNGAKDIVKDHALGQIEIIRDNVEAHQTGGITDEFIDLLEDYNPFE